MNTKRQQREYKPVEKKIILCPICNESFEGNVKEDKIKLHIDHIIPRIEGGKDNKENLTTSCQECNLGKADVLLEAHNVS